MKHLPGILAGVIAVLCAAFFILTALAALFFFNLEGRAFNPNIYEQALVEESFYQNLPLLLGQVLAREARASNTPFVQQLTSEHWATIIQTLFPPEQFRSMTEEAITQVFAYLNDETNDPQISLLPVKQRLSSAAGLDAAIRLIHAQPACTLEQLAQMITSFGQVLCNPPQEVLALAKPILQTQLSSIAASLPDQISFVDPATPPQGLRNLRAIRQFMQLTPLIPLAFLFGITIFAVRSFKGWLAWWGWPFLLAGLAGAILGFNGAPLFETALENYVSTHTSLTIPPEFSETVRAVMIDVFQKIFAPAGWQALTLAGIGLVMIVAALIISRHEKNQRIQRSEAKTQIF